MGVVNVTPDSFSDGGQFTALPAAVAHALQMAEEGAGIIDVGGESTRPGSEPVTLDEELRRVIPVLESLAGQVRVPRSVDTMKAEVARRMQTSRAALDRLLDAQNGSVTLNPLYRAAAAVGRQVRLELV